MAGEADEGREVIHLASEADANYKVRGRVFDGVDIHGPAVCVLIGGLGELTNCTFDAPAHMTFWEVPDRDLVGLIRIQDTSFRNCRFFGVGFVGPAEAVKAIHDSFPAGDARDPRMPGGHP